LAVRADAPVTVEPMQAPMAQGLGALPGGSGTDHAGPAWAGAGIGLASAALVLGGSVAIAIIDDPDSEPVTRGTVLGVATLSVPTLAILTAVTRRRAQVKGFSQVRAWAWAAWSGAVVNLSLQWFLALDDRSVTPGLTIGAGVMGALGPTIHALDALATARRAKLRFDYHIGPMSLGARLRF